MSNRIKIGIIAAVCLVLSALIFFCSPVDSSLNSFLGALIKVGAMMAILWLAYPQLARLPAGLAIAIGAGAMAITVYRKLAVVVIPLLVLAWFFRPRPAGKNEKRTA